MAKMKECPICGQKVGIDRLEAHIKKVHPKESVEIEFDEDEVKEIKKVKKAHRPSGKPKGKWVLLISFIMIIIIVTAFIAVPSGLKVGDVPPDFALTDTNFQQWTLSTHLTDGDNRPILLEFMHPQCSACQSMTPILKQIYDNYAIDLEMITIFVTLEIQGYTNPPTVQMANQFKTTHETYWTYLVETSGTKVRDLYEITGTPTFYLLGKDGKIAYIQVGGQDYYTMIGNILPYI